MTSNAGTTQVPFVDFHPQYLEIKDEVLPGIEKIFEKGNFILGEEAQKFEEEFAQFCGVKYGVGVNSGTDALYLALGTLNVGPGDEVIMPTHTFIATALCVSYTGATPVFVDIEDETYNLDPEALKKAITPRTKVILPVHIYGQTANMAEILEQAGAKGIKVVEDACQAHGAQYNGRRSGSLGDIGCFSFYPTKGLGAFGDAGIIVTDDDEVYEKAQMLRDYGRRGRYEHTIKGFNSRLDTIQAVVLSSKLKRLDGWNQKRQDKAAYYIEQLAGIPGLRPPMIKDDRTHVFQTFAVRVKNRDQVIEKLKDMGVGALIHYPIPLHLQGAYKELGHKKGDFPVAEQVADEIMSLPMFPHITNEQIDRVVACLKTILGG